MFMDLSGEMRKEGLHRNARVYAREPPQPVVGAPGNLLSSGLSPSAPEFHRILRPFERSRAITAGGDFHPAPKVPVNKYGATANGCQGYKSLP